MITGFHSSAENCRVYVQRSVLLCICTIVMRSSRARQTTNVSVEENPDRTGRGSQVSEFSPPEGDVVEEDVGNGLSQQNQNLLEVVRQELQRSLEANTRELMER